MNSSSGLHHHCAASTSSCVWAGIAHCQTSGPDDRGTAHCGGFCHGILAEQGHCRQRSVCDAVCGEDSAAMVERL